jgi:hypothetical protein
MVFLEKNSDKFRGFKKIKILPEKRGLKPRPSRTAFLDSLLVLELFMSDIAT